jgi:hypothetical protein
MSDENFADTGEYEDLEHPIMILCAKDPRVKMVMQEYMIEMY